MPTRITPLTVAVAALTGALVGPPIGHGPGRTGRRPHLDDAAHG